MKTPFAMARVLAAIILAITSLCVHAWDATPGGKDLWSKGKTIQVFVDPIPADAPARTSEAVDEAIAAWNAA